MNTSTKKARQHESADATARRLIKRMGWAGAEKYAAYQEDITEAGKWSEVARLIGEKRIAVARDTWLNGAG